MSSSSEGRVMTGSYWGGVFNLCVWLKCHGSFLSVEINESNLLNSLRKINW